MSLRRLIVIILLTIVNLAAFSVYYRVEAFAQWKQVGVGLPYDIVCLGSTDSFLFAGTKVHGVFRFRAGDQNWMPSDSGMLGATNIHAFAAKGIDIYAATTRGVFHSGDQGASWSIGNPIGTSDSRSLLIVDSELYAGTANGIFLSHDKGHNWKSLSFGLTDRTVYAMILLNGRIFAGTYAGVSALKLGDTTWASVNNSLLERRYVRGFATIGDTLFAGTDSGVYVSRDNAVSWKNSSAGLPDSNIRSIVGSGNTVFVGTDMAGFYESFDFGRTWKWSGKGLQYSVWTAVIWGDSLVVGGGGVWERPVWQVIAAKVNPRSDLTTDLLAFPDPFTSSVTLSYSSSKGDRVSLSVVDLLGRVVYSTPASSIEAGTHNLTIPTTSWKSGRYFVRLRIGDESRSCSILLAR